LPRALNLNGTALTTSKFYKISIYTQITFILWKEVDLDFWKNLIFHLYTKKDYTNQSSRGKTPAKKKKFKLTYCLLALYAYVCLQDNMLRLKYIKISTFYNYIIINYLYTLNYGDNDK